MSSLHAEMLEGMRRGVDARLGDLFDVSVAPATASEDGLIVGEPTSGCRLACRLCEAGAPTDAQKGGFLLAPRPDAPRLLASGALLSSGPVGSAIEPGNITLEQLSGLPWPTLTGAFEAQLSVLWRRLGRSDVDRAALLGAIDRVAAELYGLDLDELMRWSHARDAQLRLV